MLSGFSLGTNCAGTPYTLCKWGGLMPELLLKGLLGSHCYLCLSPLRDPDS